MKRNEIRTSIKNIFGMLWDCAFDIKKKEPLAYQKMSWGISNLELFCYPDEELEKAREEYFENLEEQMEEHNLRYSEERVFQDEVQRTLLLVFEADFQEYL